MERLTLEHINGLIENETYDIDPQVIVCKLTVGDATIVGTSYCFHKSSHDEERGKKSARDKAISKLFDLEAYHQKRLRVTISDEEQTKAEKLIQLQNRQTAAKVFVNKAFR